MSLKSSRRLISKIKMSLWLSDDRNFTEEAKKYLVQVTRQFEKIFQRDK